jgi:DNA polymerase I-like protein with 3'-5' exonuclease and polymerase domains
MNILNCPVIVPLKIVYLKQMEVIVIESETFKRLEDMFEQSQAVIKQQAEIITASKIGLMSAKQVADLTGYHVKTIALRKSEIGYSTMGKDLRFKPADVQAWINKYYRGPKRR